MTITPDEFRRILKNTFAAEFHPSADHDAVYQRQDGRVRLILSPQAPRRIGVITLPVLRLQLEFVRLTGVQVRAFMQRFDRAFQRGGG